MEIVCYLVNGLNNFGGEEILEKQRRMLSQIGSGCINIKWIKAAKRSSQRPLLEHSQLHQSSKTNISKMQRLTIKIEKSSNEQSTESSFSKDQCTQPH